jgi:NAD(P)-dependent dehydrogenase (short-subunit alcohol dehydrogenase family)
MNADVRKLFDLSGRVALVTGAAGHLGRAMAESLCEAGAVVVLVGRRRGRLEELAARLGARGLSASVLSLDLTDPSTAGSIAEAVRERHGRLDVLVNNAYDKRAGSLATATPDDFESSYRIGVVAPVRLMQALLPLLAEGAERTGGSSSVINISSMYGQVSPDPAIYDPPSSVNPPFYGAAKAALSQLTRYAACQYATQRVRVNAIAPGPFPEHPSPLDPHLCRKTPLGRTGEPWELKGAVLFLASDASSYITGAVIPVDGGWTAW